MSLQLVRVVDALPEGFGPLRAAADAEGHRNMRRLGDDWASGAQRFDREGEVLLAAFVDGDLAGVGAVTQEPEPADKPALRMRRLYVAPRFRRQGVARAIANALLQESLAHAALITVHAGGDVAARFWESQGFHPCSEHPWSHELRRDDGATVSR